ncbi:hypothetical protein B0J12DRAFT_162875 [Macrophomina phaseolina]|uniref:Zn(2)-C6 fungal-type domain-containing protein n=1 Tax=Macrophomina phaseolina TaxID=35725 RepID=A0ABQ8GRX3_9PEZI|nr:hypothetical protein B0J12DRAFT_162875 [Macrophomina phaseolina]
MPNSGHNKRQSTNCTAFEAGSARVIAPKLLASTGAPNPLRRRDPCTTQRPRPTPKRTSITPVACQPCQQRKHKCDGARPVCSPCLMKKRNDCVYDAAGDCRRTSVLKQRIRDLTKLSEDLEEIIIGISAAADRDAAIAAAQQLVVDDFRGAADIANAFRRDEGDPMTAFKDKIGPKQEYMESSRPSKRSISEDATLQIFSSTVSTTKNAGLDYGGRMPFSYWPFHTHAETIGFIQTGFENFLGEVRDPEGLERDYI